MRYFRVRTESGPVIATESDGDLRALDPDSIPTALAGTTSVAAEDGELGTVGDTRLIAPLEPGKIIAIGLNYRDHIAESGLPTPESPLIFAKFPSSVIGPGEPIRIDPELTSRVDWEVELGAVIGSRMKNVAERDALAGVFGYTVGNDVSARDLQFGDGQWTRGKSLDTFCPLGPCIVTADEVADPQDIRLMTRVNGETVQDASTAEMIFSVAELLAYCSRHFTLEPGDLLLTGTPWGCGEFMDPKRHLLPCDVVEVEAERIGLLENPVAS
jgi:2-keto-4-pentenoate hydratase/2-oxohepta-3-ene-1,7-dioic acid hydratase in catechol pathway